MPIELFLAIPLEPGPLDLFPEFLNASTYFIFGGVILAEILFYSEQPLYHQGGFYQVGTIVIGAERNSLSGLSVKPM